MILGNVRLGGDLVDLELTDGVIAALLPAGAGEGERHDAEGRWLIPGLWDEHVHFSQWALGRRRIDVREAASAREAARMLRKAAEASRHPLDAGAPVIGVGFSSGLWPRKPSKEVLDAVFEEVPVVVISSDVHSAWLNSVALLRFGFPDHPTGLLVENDCWRALEQVDDVPDSALDEWISDAGQAAAARGVVGITDLSFGWNLENWTRRVAGGFDSLRVDVGFYTEHLDDAIGRGLRSGQRLSELVSVGPYKVITDGSLNTRTALCVDPYPGESEHPHGVLNVSIDELTANMRRAVDAGIVPAIHAIGDETNRLVLDAFEAIGAGGRIEHAQLLRAEDLPRFARLNVEASVQPEHAMDDRDVADRYWADRTDRAFLLRSLLKAGARLRFGSDAPVAPLDPWLAIAAAVERSRGGRDPWHPEQRITRAEALTASVRSSVAVGQPADLVLVDADPLATPASDLRRMPVAATLLGGRFTHTSW